MPSTPEDAPLRRRTLLQAGAWSVPVIALAASTPAAAATGIIDLVVSLTTNKIQLVDGDVIDVTVEVREVGGSPSVGTTFVSIGFPTTLRGLELDSTSTLNDSGVVTHNPDFTVLNVTESGFLATYPSSLSSGSPRRLHFRLTFTHPGSSLGSQGISGVLTGGGDAGPGNNVSLAVITWGE